MTAALDQVPHQSDMGMCEAGRRPGEPADDLQDQAILDGFVEGQQGGDVEPDSPLPFLAPGPDVSLRKDRLHEVIFASRDLRHPGDTAHDGWIVVLFEPWKQVMTDSVPEVPEVPVGCIDPERKEPAIEKGPDICRVHLKQGADIPPVPDGKDALQTLDPAPRRRFISTVSAWSRRWCPKAIFSARISRAVSSRKA